MVATSSTQAVATSSFNKLVARPKAVKKQTDPPNARRSLNHGTKVNRNGKSSKTDRTAGSLAGGSSQLRGLPPDITTNQRSSIEHEVLSEIIQGVITTSSLDELLQLIHQSLKKVLYAENCFVSFYDKKTGLFHKRFCVDKFDSNPSPQKMTRSCSAYVFRTSKPLLLTQETFDQLLASGEVELVGHRAPSWLGVPLITPRECIGVLVVQHYEKENIYRAKDVAFLSSVGIQVAMAIERKLVEDELRHRERQLAEAQRMALLGGWEWNIGTDTVTWSAELYRMCGVDEGKFGATYGAFLEFVHPDDRELVEQSITKALRNHQPVSYEFRLNRPDGTQIVMQARGEVLQDETGRATRMIGVAQDVTEKRNAEQALINSEARFRELFDDAPIGYHELDIEGRITCINKTELSMLGYSAEEMLGRYAWDFVKDRQTARRNIKGRLTGTRALRAGKQIYKRKDGTFQPVQLSNRILKSPNGQIIGMRTTVEDITDRELADRAVREAEARYRDLVENARDVIYTHDMDGRYTSLNRAAEQITGYTRQQALAMNVYDVIAPEFVDTVRAMTEQKLAGKEITVYEIEIVASDGHRVPVEVSSRFIYKDGLPIGVQGIARDVSERKQLEEQLRQSQKLESVGQLAGGIAHDFNNLLTAISGYSQIVLRRLPENDPTRHNVIEIKKASDRAASLTHQLLAFSRKQVLEPKVLDLNEVVTDMDKLLARLIGEDIRLITKCSPSVERVKADPGQLAQVIINLAVNSRDAMPNGGKVTIETRNIVLDEMYARTHRPIRAGRYVMLTVSDTGEGMDSETRKQIFEPFFTTKEVGKGTGLGLSLVYGVVKQSGGYIFAESEVGRGTSFNIFLPPAEGEVEETGCVTVEVPRGNGTVLLVEDEQPVREVVRDFLEIEGYQVLEASNGAQAIEVCERHNSTIDLLITDVIMPKMGGSELAQTLTKRRPDLKVLYMSGYADDDIARQGILKPGTNFLHKPFTPEILARKVHETMSTSSVSS